MVGSGFFRCHLDAARKLGRRLGGAVAIALVAAGGASARAQGPAAPAAREEILVFAAASLSDVLAEIGKAWESGSGSRAVFNFGASNDLARQIAAGALADVFFSADTAQMEGLVQKGLVRRAESRELLSNTLVVVVPSGSTARVAGARDLVAFGKLALADPRAVPAGVYARSWLEAEGVWSEIEPRVVPTLHVRAALTAVESGNADAGIVYRTDAARRERARIAYEVPAERGPKIFYPVAPLAARKAAAPSFVAYLGSPAAREVFVRHGFAVLAVD